MKYMIFVSRHSRQYSIGPFDYDVRPIVFRLNKFLQNVTLQSNKVWEFMYSNRYFDDATKDKEIKAINRVLSAKVQVISKEEYVRLRDKLNQLLSSSDKTRTKQKVIDFAKSNNLTDILLFLNRLPDVFDAKHLSKILNPPYIYAVEVKLPDKDTEDFWDKIIHTEIAKGKKS